MQLYKYEALGNDYLILDAQVFPKPPSPEEIKAMCHRHYGIGSDGLLYGPLPTDKAQFKLKIYNPDGSEAEKSGNGLRIFAKYLWDRALVKEQPFTLETLGGIISCKLDKEGEAISVNLGKAQFLNTQFPEPESLNLEGVQIDFYPVSIGNPHAIIRVASLDKARLLDLGPKIENHPRFLERTNVQFAKVVDSKTLHIAIWERGAGYTLASGSSAAACAAWAVKLRLCSSPLHVLMEGGELTSEVNPEGEVIITGPAKAIAKIDLIF